MSGLALSPSNYPPFQEQTLDGFFEKISQPKNALIATGAWSILGLVGSGIHIKPCTNIDIKTEIYRRLMYNGVPSGAIAGTFIASSIASMKFISLVNKGIAAGTQALGFKYTLHLPEKVLGIGMGFCIAHIANRAFNNISECHVNFSLNDTLNVIAVHPATGLGYAYIGKYILDNLAVEIKSDEVVNSEGIE